MMRDVVKVCWLSIHRILLPGHVHRYTTLTLDLDLITDCPATCRATPYRLPVPSPLPTTTPCAHPTLAMTTRLFSLPSFATMSPSLPVRGEQQAQQSHVHESEQAGRQAGSNIMPGGSRQGRAAGAARTPVGVHEGRQPGGGGGCATRGVSTIRPRHVQASLQLLVLAAVPRPTSTPWPHAQPAISC